MTGSFPNNSNSLKTAFEKGEVVDYKGDNVKIFDKFLESNTGDIRKIAELGIGTNPGAEYIGGYIIVDEKIMGTIHIAIGNNGGAFGGKNRASAHLDMIKPFETGKIYSEGKVIVDFKKLLQKYRG